MKNILLLFLVFIFISSKFVFAGDETLIFEEQILEEKDEKIEDKKNNIGEVIEKVLNSTVSVEAIKLENININKSDKHFVLEKFGNVIEVGTGFLIDENGFIITNSHVVDGSNKIIITLNNKEYQAELVGNDYYLDIAILKINDGSKKFKFLELDPNVKTTVGEKIFVVGNPYGLGLSVSRGIISALHRDIKGTGYNDMIQTDANINKGNSGGPMFNENGDIIGINSVIFSTDNGKNVGVNFAIPISNIIKSIIKIKEFGFIQRGWIGINGVDATDDIFKILNSKRETGILVKEVQEGSPAEKAGILPSDVIISYNHKYIKNYNDLLSMIRNSSVNSSASILILRAGKYIKLKVNVKELPNNLNYQDIYDKIIDNSTKFMDMVLVSVDKNTINKFKLYGGYENRAMYVLNVEKGGIADRYGVETGDFILSINQIQLKNKAILDNIINNINKNSIQDEVLMVIKKTKTLENLILKVKIKN